jgi:hypothetical protein
MRRTKRLSLGLGAVVILSIVLLAATPAQAEFPEGWSVAWFDVGGGFNDCVDFRPCTDAGCPARFFAADKKCTYTEPENFGFQQTRTTITCNNFNWLGFVPVQKFRLNVTCSREGGAFWRFVGGTFATGSCAAEVVYRNFGGPADFNEGYSGITIAGFAANGRGRCGAILSAPGGLAVENRLGERRRVQ